MTIGVDFALKRIKSADGTRIKLQLWDIAGHERFGHMTQNYYKFAIAAIVVFDLGRSTTFDSVIKVRIEYYLRSINTFFFKSSYL